MVFLTTFIGNLLSKDAEGGGGGSPDLGNATFAGSFSITLQATSTQGNAVGGIAFSATGDKMFVQGRRSDGLFYVFEYDLSTNFDVTSAVYKKQFQLNVGAAEDIAFNTDGTKMFIPSDGSDDRVYQYNLSTGFDVSTASASPTGSKYIQPQESQIRGVTFSATGDKMFIVGHNQDRVFEYTLSTPFDFGGTTTYSGNSFLVSAQETLPESVRFNNDGTKMYIVGRGTDTIYEYSLSVGFDVSTANPTPTNTLSTRISADGADERNPTGIAFSTSGDKIYFVGIFQKRVFQYNLT